MKEILQKYISVLGKDRARRKKLVGVLTVLSICVVLSVAWQLRFVGIAQSDKPTCGLEEHEHTDKCMKMELICGYEEGQPETDQHAEAPQVHHHTEDCYQEVKTLSCPEEEHVHGDKCYKIEKTLTCVKEEHTHGPACYQQEKNLICTDTSEDHVHGDECYEIKDILICDKEEHTHSDDCYKIERTLICEKPEHSHSDACYTIEKKLACGMEEGQEIGIATADEVLEGKEPKLHVHTDKCYKVTYTCGKQEHIHTLDCYANSNADVETKEVWERTLPKKLGRTWNENLLLVAQSQLGYRESMKNYKIAEDGETRRGYSRYGQWANNPHGEWNTMFTCFCLRYAGIPDAAVPRQTGAFAMSVKLEDLELFTEAEGYTPKPGDIVFMQDLEAENINRTAIVVDVSTMLDKDNQKVPCINIIEGDRDNAVAPYHYALDDEVVMGYLDVTAAEKRAKELGILPEAVPEQPQEEENNGPEILTEEQLDGKLKEALTALADQVTALKKAEADENFETAKSMLPKIEEVLNTVKTYHLKRYPDSKDGDFEAYMTANAEDAYAAYEEAVKRYAEEKEEPQQNEEALTPEELDAKLTETLVAFTAKVPEFTKAEEAGDEETAKALKLELDTLFFQMKSFHLKRYPDSKEGDFEAYMTANAAEGYGIYQTANEKYPAQEPAPEKTAEEKLDVQLKEVIASLQKKADQFKKAQEEKNEETSKAAKLEMDMLLKKLQELHLKRYPDAKEGDFEAYMTANAAELYSFYLEADKLYPAEKPQEVPEEEEEEEIVDPHALRPETAKLLKVMEEKAYAYEQAVANDDQAQIRSLSDQMNILYDQAKALYFEQYTELGDAAYTYYINENCPKAAAMLQDAEERLGSRALDATLKGKMASFGEKAKLCAQHMNVGETEKAKALKLELDQLYIEMADLHAKRYPNAGEKDFEQYLNNNNSKAVRWYLSAVDAFQEVQLENVITFTDPVTGELQRVFKLQDGMEVQINVSGSLCFPVEQQVEKPLDAKETTESLNNVVKNDGTVVNTTQELAQGKPPVITDPDAGITTLEEMADPDAGLQTTDLPADPNAAPSGENPPENDAARWKNLKVDVVPVDHQAELDFAKYVAENHPEAESMTMLGLDYKYNDNKVDVTSAKVDMMMTPAAAAPTAPVEPAPKMRMAPRMLMAAPEKPAPVMQNAKVVESASNSMYFKGDPMLEDEPQLKDQNQEFVILERDAKGKITPVASAPMNPAKDQIPDVTIQPRVGATYAAVVTPTEQTNRKPIDPNASIDGRTYPNAKAYPETWGEHVKDLDGGTIAFTTDENGDRIQTKLDNGKNLRLLNDPYFQEAPYRWPAENGVYGFETPSATLGYVLRNYNVFTFGDAIVNHVVGSSAVQGDAYYKSPQGGTGGTVAGRYVPIPNFAPSFIQGRMRQMDAQFDEPTQTKKDLGYKKSWLSVKVNAGIIQEGQPVDMGFPTYFGTVNKDNPPAGKTSWIEKCTLFTDEESGQGLPYYFVDHYIDFDHFYNEIKPAIENDAIEGIPVTRNAKATIAHDHYQWIDKGNHGHPVLFLRMGYSYNVGALISKVGESAKDDKTLQGVQICLVPPDGYDWGGIPRKNVAERAAKLGLDKLNTVITSDAREISLPTSASEQKGHMAILYYIDDISQSNPFKPESGNYTDASLADYVKPDSSNSFVMVFPYAEVIHHTKRVGHLVAPNADVYISNAGDSYGCTIAKSVHCPADLHMLPYNGSGKGIEVPPLPKPEETFKHVLNKRILKDNKKVVPAEGDAFKFQFKETRMRIFDNGGQHVVTYELGQDGKIDNRAPKIFMGYNIADKIVFDNFHLDKDKDKFGNKTGNVQYLQEEIVDHVSGRNLITMLSNMGNYTMEVTYELTETDPGEYKKDDRTYYLTVKYGFDSVWDGNIGTYGKLKMTYMDSYQLTNRLLTEEEQNKNVTSADVDQVIFLNEPNGYVGPELPHTGGIGVLPFIVTGLAFTLLPITLLYSRKRKERR